MFLKPYPTQNSDLLMVLYVAGSDELPAHKAFQQLPLDKIVHHCIHRSRVNRLQDELIRFQGQKEFHIGWERQEPPSDVIVIELEGLEHVILFRMLHRSGHSLDFGRFGLHFHGGAFALVVNQEVQFHIGFLPIVIHISYSLINSSFSLKASGSIVIWNTLILGLHLRASAIILSRLSSSILILKYSELKHSPPK